MPLFAPGMAYVLETQFFSAIKKKSGKAKKTKELKALASAIAAGAIGSIIKSRGSIAPTGGLGSTAFGLKGVSSRNIRDVIIADWKNKFKGANMEKSMMRDLAQAIGLSLVAQLNNAQIIGTDAGKASKFKGWTASQMASIMLSQSGFKPNKYNRALFKIIAGSITKEVQQNAFAIILPSGAPGTAGRIAIIF